MAALYPDPHPICEIAGQALGRRQRRTMNRQAYAAQFPFVIHNPQSGLAEDWGHDLEGLIAGYLGLRWKLLTEQAARQRASASHEPYKLRPASFQVSMEPTDRWGLPTPACEAYAAALILVAGDFACAFAMVSGAGEDAVRAALGAAIERVKES